MPELLTGTVTFLFSDIEGSTRLLQSQGAEWPRILERHGELLRAAFAAHDGTEVGTEGDSFFVVFPTAPGAVAAAAAAQRALAAEPWPDDAVVRVRVGMHTGEASFSAKTYAGLNVHRASRIASVGHGGQVLLSDATRGLVEHALPDGVSLRDLGEHRLKDLDQPERLWQLVISDLETEFPAIASLGATPNNLPTRLTTFLGREREIDDLGALLAEHRLVTLTGPGGTGKTRLSLEAATRALGRYPDGVYFVELAAITAPDLVPATIGQALSLPDRGGRGGIDRLTDHIGDKRMLLVLDNFEQVLAAGASLNDLLRACANLSLLVSSRFALHVSGEQEFPVPPLALPDPRNLPPLTQLSQFESVALFIERARSVKPGFEVTNQNAPAVAEICVRLDGLPLAIELAAARIRILTPQAMLGRLHDRLGLLSSGSRDLPERQQTLRGAIAWSHDMLDDADRGLFAGLSVFAGTAGLDAIERVLTDDAGGDVLGALSSLVDKSLVNQVDGIAGEPRFGMLETIREFAAEQAALAGMLESLRDAHAAYFLELAETAARSVMTAERRIWLDRLDQDHDNLRAAISSAIDAGRAERAMRLASAMWRFWQMRGYLAEGVEHVARVLDMPGSRADRLLRADALSAAAGLAYWQADGVRARDWYDEEVALRREAGDDRGLAEALYGSSFTWSVLGQTDDHMRLALGAVQEALELFRRLDDESGIGRCEWSLGNIVYSTGQTAEARGHATRALSVFERIGDTFMVGWARFTLSLTLLRDDVGSNEGRPDLRGEARDHLEEALRIFAQAQDVTGYTLVLDALALVAWRDGNPQRAARLSGAVAQLERTTGTGLNLWNRGSLGFRPELLRDDPEFHVSWAEGEHLTADEAVAYALGG